MGIRGYQKYAMLATSSSQYSWASTDYTLIAVRSDVTVPTGLGVVSSTGETRDSLPTITDTTFTESFIIPTVFDVLSIIDGTVQGTLKLAASTTGTIGGTDYISITKAELTIRAIDSDGAARTIAAKQEIWSGEVKCQISDSSTTEQTMYWIDIEEATVRADERIVLDYTITYSVVDDFENDIFKASIYCTEDTDETTVTLPFVM